MKNATMTIEMKTLNDLHHIDADNKTTTVDVHPWSYGLELLPKNLLEEAINAALKEAAKVDEPCVAIAEIDGIKYAVWSSCFKGLSKCFVMFNTAVTPYPWDAEYCVVTDNTGINPRTPYYLNRYVIYNPSQRYSGGYKSWKVDGEGK